MPGFGSLVSDDPAENDLLRYYDPSLGVLPLGSGKYQPPKARSKWMMEPDLLSSQMGVLPPGVALNDAGQYVDQETAKPIKVIPRPAMLPYTQTPEGGQWVKPKIVDIAGSLMGSPASSGSAFGLPGRVLANKRVGLPSQPSEEPPPRRPAAMSIKGASETPEAETPPREAPKPVQTPPAGELPDVGPPLIPSGPQVSAGTAAGRSLWENWGKPAAPEPDASEVVAGRGKPWQVTKGDIDKAMGLAMGFSGGGLSTTGAGGLEFPAAEAAERLRMKLAREAKAATAGADLPGAPSNERTVIKAPKAKIDPETKQMGPQLPDFVAGKITPQDWVARHERLLSPQEIKDASQWYSTIYGEFLRHTNGDQDLAKQYMRAWLVAQQNVDVGGAMGNMMLQREQILRGVPEEQMKAAGMPNPTVAARRVMQNQPIEAGVGQKIADFVDSAEGKKVRSWMGNDPQGGNPFVVDVHTARDTGMVDDELKNHLTRLGYNKAKINALTTDLYASPSQTQYENRAKFGHELTDHLNKIKWQGRSDWTPAEVQAVGWMGMTKMTAGQTEDITSGLRSAMRHIAMEVAPGEGSPWAQKYGARFSALPPERQQQITHQVAEDAVNRASQLSGVDIRNIVHGTGGWKTVQNPSTVAQSFASKQGGEISANVLGHLLQQDEVWSNKVKPLTANPKGFAVDLYLSGNHNIDTDAGLRDFWNKVMAADPTAGSKNPLFQGYQPIRTADGRSGIRVLIDRGGAKTKEELQKAVSGPLDRMIKSLPEDQTVESKLHEAEIYKAGNDWKKDKNGEAYTKRLVDLLGRDPRADLNTHGAALEEKLSRLIRAAEGKPAAAAAPAAAETAAPAAKPVRKGRKGFGSLAPGKEGQ